MCHENTQKGIQVMERTQNCSETKKGKIKVKKV